jgi:hypothetical protein
MDLPRAAIILGDELLPAEVMVIAELGSGFRSRWELSLHLGFLLAESGEVA